MKKLENLKADGKIVKRNWQHYQILTHCFPSAVALMRKFLYARALNLSLYQWAE